MLPPMTRRALEGIGVLLVDDEAMVRNVLGRRLTQLGARVHEAAAVPRACELLADASLKIDVVLTDLMMPGLSGGDLIEWLRANRAQTPVIVMSASAIAANHPQPDLALRTPVTGDQLRDAISEVVSQTRATSRIPRLSRP